MGDWFIHRILSCNAGKGNASDVFKDFLKMIKTNLYLSVRKTNQKAIGFHRGMGMKQGGETTWRNGKMQGLIFYKESPQKKF